MLPWENLQWRWWESENSCPPGRVFKVISPLSKRWRSGDRATSFWSRSVGCWGFKGTSPQGIELFMTLWGSSSIWEMNYSSLWPEKFNPWMLNNKRLSIHAFRNIPTRRPGSRLSGVSLQEGGKPLLEVNMSHCCLERVWSFALGLGWRLVHPWKTIQNEPRHWHFADHGLKKLNRKQPYEWW